MGFIFLTLALLIATLWVGNVYFTWAERADLFYDTDADLAVATNWIPAHADGTSPVYIAAQDRDHPTVMIADLPNVTWLGTEMLFLPPPGQTGLVIFPRSAPPSADWADWLQPYALTDMPLAPDGRPAFVAYRLSADTPLPDLQSPSTPVQTTVLNLLGIRANPIFPNSSGEITLVWEVRQSPAQADLTPVLEIYDRGYQLSRDETPFRHTAAWRPGEVLLHRLNVKIPAATPPGKYPIRLTWVARDTETYQPFVTSSGQPTGLWATVGEIEVLPPVNFPDPADLDISNRADIDVAPGIKLLGWSTLPDSRRPGEWLDLVLFWQATMATPADIDREVLFQRDDTEITLSETPFRYPPSQWRAGEIVREVGRWSLARDLANGDYTLALRSGDTRVELGTLTIAGIPRVFEPPADITQTDIALGDSLSLHGYDVEAANTGFRLLLVWATQQPVTTDYTVFVHVLDDAGNIVAQRDVMPLDNTYPTSLWAAGAYVLDWHEFRELPDGNYAVRVGLYDQATGTRLKRGNGEDFIDLGSIPVPCQPCKPGK